MGEGSAWQRPRATRPGARVESSSWSPLVISNLLSVPASQDPITLRFHGRVELAGRAAGNAFLQIGGFGVGIEFANDVVWKSGPAELNTNVVVLPGATLTVDGADLTEVRGQLPETGITVAGTYRKLGTGTNRVQRLLNSGLVWIEQGCVQSLLSTDSPGYTQTAGELRLAGGTLDVRLGPATSTQPGRILITGGAVSGTGKITGDLTLDGGTLQPGAGPGLLEVQGQVNWRPNGVFSVEIGGDTPGSEHDQLVAATCDFDGVLEIVLRNGFQPQGCDLPIPPERNAALVLPDSAAPGLVRVGIPGRGEPRLREATHLDYCQPS